MKKLLLLLLISPLTFAEVYTFICVYKEDSSKRSIIIDTEKEYIQLDRTMFADNYKDDGKKIYADRFDINNAAFGSGEVIIYFDKITGEATKTAWLGDSFLVYKYSCSPAKPLIP